MGLHAVADAEARQGAERSKQHRQQIKANSLHAVIKWLIAGDDKQQRDTILAHLYWVLVPVVSALRSAAATEWN